MCSTNFLHHINWICDITSDTTNPVTRPESERIHRLACDLRDSPLAWNTDANPWYRAITDACVVNHIGWDDGDARKTVNNLVCYENNVALDPSVSTAARSLVQQWRNESDNILRAFVASLCRRGHCITVNFDQLDELVKRTNEHLAKSEPALRKPVAMIHRDTLASLSEEQPPLRVSVTRPRELTINHPELVPLYL